MPIANKTLSQTRVTAQTEPAATLGAPSLPLFLGPGVYHLAGPDAGSSPVGLVAVDTELVNGAAIVRETWRLPQALGNSFSIRPVPVFTSAFPTWEALRAEIGGADCTSARWLLDPARLAVTQEYPTPPSTNANANGQVVEGSWEILHRPTPTSALALVGRIYVPPATLTSPAPGPTNRFVDSYARIEVWARFVSSPPLSGNGGGELLVRRVPPQFSSVSAMRATYPAGITVREALWAYRYEYR